MHGMLRTLACAVWVVAGLASNGTAAAQSAQVCTEKTQSYNNAVCLWVSDVQLQVSESVAIEAWNEERNGGSWFHTYGSQDIRDGSTFLMQLGSSPFDHERGIHQFSTVGEHLLTARSALYGTTPAISVTVTKHMPGFSGTISTGSGPTGDFVRFDLHVNLFRPSGVLVYYVRPPGGVMTEIARTPISSGFQIIHHGQQDFLFVAPYTAAGDYRFWVTYLGDALNATAGTNEIVIRHGLQQPTSLSLTQSAATSHQAGPVTLTASVQFAPGNPAPTGSVEFRDGGVVLGAATLGPSGVATFTTRKLRKRGSHALTARYSGDGANAASTSPAVTHVVSFNAGVLAPIHDVVQ